MHRPIHALSTTGNQHKYPSSSPFLPQALFRRFCIHKTIGLPSLSHRQPQIIPPLLLSYAPCYRCTPITGQYTQNMIQNASRSAYTTCRLRNLFRWSTSGARTGTAFCGLLDVRDGLLHLASLDTIRALGLALLLAVAGVDHPRVRTAQELTY